MRKKLQEYIESKHPVEEILYQLFPAEKQIVIFDIGACEGEDTIRYKRLFPNANIYSFEPLPDNFSQIEKNLSDYNFENIHLYKKALSDIIDSAELHISSGSPDPSKSVNEEEEWNYGNKSSSLLEPAKVTDSHSWLKFENKITIQTTTISQIALEEKINHIHLVHMDVQGAEMKVLMGAGNFIDNISAFWLEVTEIEFYQNQPLRKDIEVFLKNNGFFLVTTLTQGKTADQLYIRLSENDIKSLSAKGKPKGIKIPFRKVAEGIRRRGRMSFSQSGEDMIIEHLCGMLNLDKPTYIDIGAHEPFHLNNTARLYEQGSTGINIEPDPFLFESFRKHRSKDTNLNLALSDSNKLCTLHIFASRTLNTMDEKEAERIIKEENEKMIAKHNVQMIDLYRCILLFNKGKFPDILMIDTEGLDETILNQLDEKKGLPKIICAETIVYSKTRKVEKKHELIEMIKRKGYEEYADTFINTIFYRKDLWV